MWPHFTKLLLRIVHGMPAIVSSNWMAWCLGLLGFLVYHLFVFVLRGKEEMRRQWKENIGIGIVAGLVGYLILFAISIFITIYNDHLDSTGRWRAVVNEKNALKGLLRDRDSMLANLQEQLSIRPSILEKTKFLAMPKQCWTDTVIQYKGEAGHGAAVIAIHCNYRVESPLHVNLELNGPVRFMDFHIPSLMAMQGLTTGSESGAGRAVFADLDSPSLPANQIVVFVLESLTPNAPIPLNGSITSR